MSPGPSKQFDREEVLEKAMNLFWAQGYEATGLAQLVDHVGIGRQSLYDTFGDKRTLYLEALSHYFRSYAEPQIAQLRAPGSGLANIRKVFEMWVELGKAGRFGGCMVGNSTAELAMRDPEIAATLKGYYRAVEDAFYDAIRRARDDGEIPEDRKPRDLARALVHTGQGLALLSKVMRDPETVRSVLGSTLVMLGAR